MTKIETSSFTRLLGIWRTEGILVSDKGNLKLSGTDSYERILDGHYILHKANVITGDEKIETIEIISHDDSTGKAKMRYFNSKGESGVMNGSLQESDFTIDGDRIRFSGTISNDNREVVGQWYLQTDAGDWQEYIELKLMKQS